MKLIIDIPGAYYHYTKKYHDLSYIETKVLIEALIKGTPIEEDEDCISRSDAIEFFKDDVYVVNELNNLAPVIPKQRTDYISIDDVMSVFDDFMCGEVDEDGTDTFLEMLKDKAEGSEG